MSRFFRNRWFVIVVVVIILGLSFFATISILSTTTTGKSTNGAQKSPARSSRTPTPTTLHATRTPTPSSSPTKVPLQLLRLSSDPYTNSTSQHQTEVEPGTFAYGSTIVAAYQAGRFLDRGSSNIGWATSTNGGTTWQNGFLPDTTKYVGGPYDRITDPAVSYDAAHHTWMIATVVFLQTSTSFLAPAVLVSLSTNGGTAWSNPVTVTYVGSSGYLDKDWIACDDTAASQFYGHCYIEWDDYLRNDLIQMSTSNDGGRTWGAAQATADRASGTSGYPLVQPNGTVIVPISNGNQTAITVFISTNGGASWGRTATITSVTSFPQNAYFHDDILLTPQIDDAGRVYLVWVDCRFEQNCAGNDLVMTTSTDGITWSPVRRIPIAPVGSDTSYYVSGLGIDKATSGTTAHLGLAFYYYSANCSSNCSLFTGFVSSTDGGASWSAKTQLAGPIPAGWIAQGNNKVGDYISTSFSNGRAFPVFAVGTAPGAGHFNEAMYTVQNGLAV